MKQIRPQLRAQFRPKLVESLRLIIRLLLSIQLLENSDLISSPMFTVFPKFTARNLII
jgi:hypothetical protein